MHYFIPRITAIFLLAALFTLLGCGKGSGPTGAAAAKVFDSASPQVKADWEKVLAANNDYATAVLTCRKLQRQTDLTPEQQAAVLDTLTAVNTRMTDAAQKGDPAAIKAIEEIRAHWRSN